MRLSPAIVALDLSDVKMKLMEPVPEGQGWTLAQADEAEKWYKRFLQLCLIHPDLPVVPNHQIDTIWHQHILDTRRYGEDCEAIFGHFLHHYPYYGLKGDAAERDSSFDVANTLYREYFGEDCQSMTAFTVAQAAGCRDTGGSCSKGCRQGCSRKVAETALFS